MNIFEVSSDRGIIEAILFHVLFKHYFGPYSLKRRSKTKYFPLGRT